MQEQASHSSHTPRPDAGGAALGQAVRAQREARGLTLRFVASQVGVSPATMSQLETGGAKFTVERLTAVADLLGVDFATLVANTTPSPTPSDAAVDPDDSTPAALENWREFPPLRLDPVLGAALECFAESGYAGSSVRDIAKAAALSISGIYHHYPSKQDMLAALVEAASSEALERVLAARDEGDDPVSRLRLMAEALCQFHLHRRHLAVVSANEVPHLRADDRRRISKIRWGVQELIDNGVRDGIEAGRFHTSDPKEAGRAILMLTSALPRRFHDGAQFDAAHVAYTYTEFALALVQYDGK